MFFGFTSTLSPAMVYYSRYYVQEMLLVFFTFSTIACAWRYAVKPRALWAVLTGLSVGLMHATKETCVIHLAAMFLAAVIVGLLIFWPYLGKTFGQ